MVMASPTIVASVLDAAIDQAISVLRSRPAAVLTGAGVSTDSGIPDYRGEGAPKSHPMTFDTFMQSPKHRRRYWLGSHLGWGAFARAIPNLGHQALADAEAHAVVSGVVTQNVDALHHKAGSLRVVDLHGRLDRVRCVHCGQSFSRTAVASAIEELNPWLDTLEFQGLVKPDGDVDVEVSDSFQVPDCELCGGVLKPEVVFFGEFVPPSVFDQAVSLIHRSEALIVAGSSLVVNTGMRLVSLAHRRKIPIVVINRGPTKADRMATVRIEGGTSETLDQIVAGLRL
jgi:NAD-dependent SIR2 family protein deacetylase